MGNTDGDYRRAEYSLFVGYTLTDEQCDAIDRAATELSVAYPMSLASAQWHILNIIRLHDTVRTIHIAVTAMHNSLREAFAKFNTIVVESNSAFNADSMQTMRGIIECLQEQRQQSATACWWHGLERVLARHERSIAHAQHRSKTYGTYRHTHKGRHASYWRHTRTR